MAETLKNINATINGTEYQFDNPQIAAEYSPSSTYAVGDYCTYQGQTYKCTTAITTAQAWTAANWTAVYVADDVASALSGMELLEDNVFQRVDLYPPMFISRGKRNASGTVVDGAGCVTSAIRITLDETDIKDVILVATNKAGFQIYDTDAGAYVNSDFVHNGSYHYHGQHFYLTLHNSDGTYFTPAMLQDIYFLAPADVADFLRNRSVGFECEITNTQPMLPTYGTDYSRAYYIPRYGVYTNSNEFGFLQRAQQAMRPTTAALFSQQDITLVIGRDEAADKIVTCTVCLFGDSPSSVTLTSGMLYTIPANTRFSLTFSETSGAATNNCQRYTTMIVNGTVPMLFNDADVTTFSTAHPSFTCDSAFIVGNQLWSLAKGSTTTPPYYWVRDLATNTMLASAVDAGHTFGHCNNVNYDPTTGYAYVSDWTDGSVVHVFAVDTAAYTMTYVEDITFADHTIGSADFFVSGGEAYYVGWTDGSSATHPNTLTYGLYVDNDSEGYVAAWSRKAVRPRIMQGMAVIDGAFRCIECDWSTASYHALSIFDIGMATGHVSKYAFSGEITGYEAEAVIPFDDYTSLIVCKNGFLYVCMITGE